MTAPNGGAHHPNGDGDAASTTAEQKRQYDALGAIVVTSFGAKPATVAPFASTTLGWSVKLPASLHVAVSFSLAGETVNGTSGSVRVTPFASGNYALTAHAPLVSRVIGSVAVTVDDRSCTSQGLSPASLNALVNKFAPADLFTGDGFSLAGALTVKSALGTLTIEIPIKLSIPHYFDATMTITQAFAVGMRGMPPKASLSVDTGQTSINVDWSWYADVLSLGLTSGVAALVEIVSQTFIHYIARTQLAGTIEGAFDSELVQITIDGAHAKDPAPARTFVLTSVTMDELGLAVGVCPIPLPPPPPKPIPPKQPADRAQH
jgi:hypothetical protein